MARPQERGMCTVSSHIPYIPSSREYLPSGVWGFIISRFSFYVITDIGIKLFPILSYSLMTEFTSVDPRSTHGGHSSHLSHTRGAILGKQLIFLVCEIRGMVIVPDLQGCCEK